jgi:hypothetical protein
MGEGREEAGLNGLNRRIEEMDVMDKRRKRGHTESQLSWALTVGHL